MTLEEKQQEIIDEFAIYDDWISRCEASRPSNGSLNNK